MEKGEWKRVSQYFVDELLKKCQRSYMNDKSEEIPGCKELNIDDFYQEWHMVCIF